VTSWNILQIPAYDLEHLRRETENVAGHGCVDVEGEGKSNCGGRFLLLTRTALVKKVKAWPTSCPDFGRIVQEEVAFRSKELEAVGLAERRLGRGGASVGLQLVPRVLQCQRARDSTSLEVLSTNIHVPQMLGYYNRMLRLLQTILKCTVGRVVNLGSSPR
jgi:hypothetical protein